MNDSSPPVIIGLESCLEEVPEQLRDRPFAVLCNQASLDWRFRYAHRLLADAFPGRLKAVFCPQHGLWGTEQANMIETPHSIDAASGVPIYSLYSETRKPTPAMLEGIDVLVVDLQDVGTRIYTFAWTVMLAMQACREAGISVLLLDRPNPIGGALVEGPVVSEGFRSFVGLASIPMRHALTLGELALMLNARESIGSDLHVVPMKGWRREMDWKDTGRTWVPPSPNLPRVVGVRTYPGMVLLEGTNLSEGRGTTTPFEVIGAPFLDPDRFVAEAMTFELAGVTLRPYCFRPTFDKWSGQACGGAMLHVVDQEAFRPFRTAVALMAAAWRLAPESSRWLPPPYEYETVLPPIDILSGGSAMREAFDSGRLDAESIDELSVVDEADWRKAIVPFLLYK